MIPPTERDRYSVPVFVNPEWSTLVRCLPTCTSDERPARHAPVVSGEYLQSRYDDTFVYSRRRPGARFPQRSSRRNGAFMRTELHSPMTTSPHHRRRSRGIRLAGLVVAGALAAAVGGATATSASTAPPDGSTGRPIGRRDPTRGRLQRLEDRDDPRRLDRRRRVEHHARARWRQDRSGVPRDRGRLRREHRPRPDGDERVRGRRRRRRRHGDRHHLLPGRHDGRRRRQPRRARSSPGPATRPPTTSGTSTAPRRTAATSTG